MNLLTQIERAFGHRSRPQHLVESHDVVTPEQRDALWFSGRDWRAVTYPDWEHHRDAFYAFTPEAFAYYLPSILSLTANDPKFSMEAAGALLRVLDRSPTIFHWDAFITRRLIGLEAAEYEAMKSWLLSLSDGKDRSREDALARAYETVELLKHETERVRRLVEQ